MMRNKKRKNKNIAKRNYQTLIQNPSMAGITLISLIVSLIVLLILAGVTIATLTGENGILTQTQNAKKQSEKAEIIEQIRLDIAEKQIENQGSINEDEFYEVLGRYGTVSADETILTTTKGNYEILISDIYNGEIASSLVTTPLESWEYIKNDADKTVRLTKYVGKDNKIFIPDTFEINGVSYSTVLSYTNSATSSGPFINNTVIERVKFGKNVQGFINSADGLFYGATNLKKVYNLPNNYTELGNVFALCTSLEYAPEIPSGVTAINGLFSNCYSLITAPEIPETVTDMSNTFFNCFSLEGKIIIKSNNVTIADNCFNNTKNIIYLSVKENTTTYSTFMNNIENWNNVYFENEKIINVSCWGDSLTAGSGGNGTSFVSVLAKCNRLLRVNNKGVPGETSKAIAERQGGIPIYTNSFTIPSDTSKVEIEIKDSGNQNVSLAGQGDAGLNPCSINSVEGTISRNGTQYYFNRSNEGEPITVESGTRIITEGMQNHRNDIMIIWSGTNDVPNSTNIQSVINNIDSMIEYSNIVDYIVIGLTSKDYMPEIEEVNKMLASKYGEHFLDIRKYILENGLSDAGINATAQDLENLENGEIPISLRSDNVHLNSYGYTIVGEQVYNKLISLGYITK